MRFLSAATLAIVQWLILPAGFAPPSAPVNPMLVRIAEIEIDPRYFDEYTTILRKEAAASVRLERGVVCIFPMSETDHPSRIRIVEIYASADAYEAHLKSTHFQEYKSTTLHMVKSLNLIQMSAIDAETMTALFRKLP